MKSRRNSAVLVTMRNVHLVGRLLSLMITLAIFLLAGCQSPAGTPTEMPATAAATALSVTATAEETMTEESGNGADANVEHVRAVQNDDGTWTFHVTVRHSDTGWEDYANGWDVVTPQGTVLKANADDAFTRMLLHPHENEQPFTRSQRGLEIPQGVTQVTVRAHDIVDGFGGQEVVVDLTQETGTNFEVERR